ncbi:hypothetical protein JD969_00075 [Planctomycetota bacterium]|nr:hypothetical protein JD969_00075 [Planctomycetota bacterium]
MKLFPDERDFTFEIAYCLKESSTSEKLYIAKVIAIYQKHQKTINKRLNIFKLAMFYIPWFLFAAFLIYYDFKSDLLPPNSQLQSILIYTICLAPMALHVLLFSDKHFATYNNVVYQVFNERNLKPEFCIECQYDLRHSNSPDCPECGKIFTDPQHHNTHTQFIENEKTYIQKNNTIKPISLVVMFMMSCPFIFTFTWFAFFASLPESWTPAAMQVGLFFIGALSIIMYLNQLKRKFCIGFMAIHSKPPTIQASTKTTQT